MAFAMLITVLGFLMLFDRMGILTSEVWGYFWPLVVIGVGLSMMFNKMHHNHFFFDCWAKENHKSSSAHRKK